MPSEPRNSIQEEHILSKDKLASLREVGELKKYESIETTIFPHSDNFYGHFHKIKCTILLVYLM